ncbi:pyrroline-5-carboxylate reductase [Candidatus Bathyarchaeota archaeon]|jgi:pyrroline-5-carboxylate reductase|nr:pyrroline-5-carboxylate reductase [Candidatus Bathyarchaeota archaeon]
MNDKVAVIGAGMMGGAIVQSLLKSGYTGKITAVDIIPEKLKEQEKLGVAVSSDSRKAAEAADVIFICVKPNSVKTVLTQINNTVKDKLVISIAATVPLKYLKKFVPDAKIVRIMPNVAALVQASYTAYCCGENVTKQDKEKIRSLLTRMGVCEEVDEKYMDAITALTGSGPGYISIIIEALMYSGLKVGLPRKVALYGAAQTVLGTGKLVLDLQEHPAKVKDMVTTPGGTTIEAIYELEGSSIRQALMRAVEEAAKKSRRIREELGVNSE